MIGWRRDRGRATADDAAWSMPVFAKRVIKGLAPVVCPPELETLRAVNMVADHVEASVGALGHGLRVGLLAGVRAYDTGALVRFGRRAHRLDAASARRYFEMWLRLPGPGHEFAQGIKSLICMAFYELPEVKEQLGYRPAAWIAQVDARHKQQFHVAIERHARSVCAPDPLPSELVPRARLTRRLRERDPTARAGVVVVEAAEGESESESAEDTN